MERLLRDLQEEQGSLDSMVASLSEADWDRVTPFGNWSIRDEIIHLAYFDGYGTSCRLRTERGFCPAM